jgi:hypothetical protein
MTSFSASIFNVRTLFKHKGHEGREGKAYEIKVLFPLYVLGALRV